MSLLPSDLEGAVRWMEARWGKVKVWEDGLVDLYADFERFPVEGFRAELEAWYRAGHAFAPKPSEMLEKLVARFPVSVDRPDPEGCVHPKPWGFSVLDGVEVWECRFCLKDWPKEEVDRVW